MMNRTSTPFIQRHELLLADPQTSTITVVRRPAHHLRRSRHAAAPPHAEGVEMSSTSSVADQTLNVEGFRVLFLNQYDGGAENWRFELSGRDGPVARRPTDAREGRHR